MATKFTSVDEYVNSFSGATKDRMIEFRKIVQDTLPDAKELINYNIPAYRCEDMWVAYFCGFAKHSTLTLGGPLGVVAEHFEAELKPYKTSYSAIQFPHDKPLPEELIRSIIIYRTENRSICD